jgi:hypothetical protein
MPALFGYVVAVSMLLGGAYAGLQWLSTPEPMPVEKSAAHAINAADKSAAIKMGALAVPNAADRKRNAGAPGKTAATERSDEIGREAKNPDPNATAEGSKIEKADGVPAGGCSPIGLTANGDLVFSMQCQDMIERHRGELVSSEVAQTPAAPAEDQAARSARPDNNERSNDGGKDVGRDVPNHDAGAGTRNDVAAKDELRPSNRIDPEPEHEIARRDSSSRTDPPDDHRALSTPPDSVTAGESRSGGPNRDLEVAPAKSAKHKQSPRTRPEAILRTAERHDAAREQRLSQIARSRRMAARGDSDLWYNILGLR